MNRKIQNVIKIIMYVQKLTIPQMCFVSLNTRPGHVPTVPWWLG